MCTGSVNTTPVVGCGCELSFGVLLTLLTLLCSLALLHPAWVMSPGTAGVTPPHWEHPELTMELLQCGGAVTPLSLCGTPGPTGAVSERWESCWG